MKVYAVVTDYFGYSASVEKLFFSKEEANQKRDEHMSMPDLCYYYVR